MLSLLNRVLLDWFCVRVCVEYSELRLTLVFNRRKLTKLGLMMPTWEQTNSWTSNVEPRLASELQLQLQVWFLRQSPCCLPVSLFLPPTSPWISVRCAEWSWVFMTCACVASRTWATLGDLSRWVTDSCNASVTSCSYSFLSRTSKHRRAVGELAGKGTLGRILIHTSNTCDILFLTTFSFSALGVFTLVTYVLNPHVQWSFYIPYPHSQCVDHWTPSWGDHCLPPILPS